MKWIKSTDQQPSLHPEGDGTSNLLSSDKCLWVWKRGRLSPSDTTIWRKIGCLIKDKETGDETISYVCGENKCVFLCCCCCHEWTILSPDDELPDSFSHDYVDINTLFWMPFPDPPANFNNCKHTFKV